MLANNFLRALEHITHTLIGRIMKKIFLSIASIVFIFFSLQCGGAWRKPLKNKREDYLGTALKLSGVYYNKDFRHFFFYKNGVCHYTGCMSNLNDIKTFWERNGHDSKYLNNSAPGWGVFSVENAHITIEQWVGGDAGQKYPTSIIQGLILNDTTMLLEGKPFGRDTFFFHYTPIKPDSTNRFIK